MSQSDSYFFQNYTEWHEALTERAGIQLTGEYARTRIAALQNVNDPHTRDFTARYGDAYREQVIQWFEQAQRSA